MLQLMHCLPLVLLPQKPRVYLPHPRHLFPSSLPPILHSSAVVFCHDWPVVFFCFAVADNAESDTLLAARVTTVESASTVSADVCCQETVILLLDVFGVCVGSFC